MKPGVRACALCNRCTDPSCCERPCHHLIPPRRTDTEQVPVVLLVVWVISVVIFVVGAIKGW